MSAIIIPFPNRSVRDARTTASAAHGVIDRDVVHAVFGPDEATEQTEDAWFREANRVLDRVEAMLDGGAARDVTGLCEQALWCVLDAAPEIDDGDCVMALVDRLRELHVRACRLDPPEPAELAEFAYRLATSDAMGVLRGVIDPYLPLLGDAGVAVVRRRLAADEVRMGSASAIMRSILEFRLRPVHESLARVEHPSATASTASQRRDPRRRRGSAS
jgi:hypothetical protein